MSFATAEDVATRLGRELTPTEAATAESLLEAATGVIATACGKDDDWATALTPVPQMVRFMCIELVVRTIGNPEGLSRLQEQLGAHSYTKAFAAAAAGGGLMLTDVEERLVRRAVFGRLSGSATVASITDDLYCS